MNRERALDARIAPARIARSFAAALAAVSVVAMALPAAAAGKAACYSRAEHAAEQAIRMHTELMVIGLTCQGLAAAADPFGVYQDFTIKNRAFISAQEGVLMGHFRKAGGNATRQFDSYRTDLANEISRRAAIVGNHVYCWNYVDRAKAALQLSQAQLKALMAEEKGTELMHLSSKPLCDVKVVSNPDPVYDVAAIPQGGKSESKTTPTPAPAPAKAAAAKPAKAPAKTSADKTAAAAKPAAKPVAKPAAKPVSDKVAANYTR